MRTLSGQKVIMFGKMLLFLSTLDFQAAPRQSGINFFRPVTFAKSFRNTFKENSRFCRVRLLKGFLIYNPKRPPHPQPFKGKNNYHIMWRIVFA